MTRSPPIEADRCGSGETNAIATAVTNAVGSGHLARARLIDAAGQVLAVRHVNLC